MQHSRPAPPKHPSSVKKVLKVAGICFGVLLLAALSYALITIDLWHVHFGYGSAAARYRASGMPWTDRDLKLPQIPEEKNGAPMLLALLNKYAEIKQPQPELDPSLLDEANARKLAAYLEPKNALLDEYRALAGMECRWERGWQMTQGATLAIQELASMKALAKDLAFRSELHSFQGNVKGSIEDLRMGASLAKQVGSDGFLLPYLVEVAARSNLFQSVRKSASYHLDEPQILKAYADALDDFLPDPSIAQAIRAEAYISLTSLRSMGYFELVRGGEAVGYDMDGGPPRPARRKMALEGDPKSFLARSLAVPILNAYAEAGEIMKAEGTSPAALSKAVDLLDRRGKSAAGASGTMARLSLSVYKTAFLTSLKTSADRGTTKAALLIAAARAQKGSMTNAEVDALLPIDPYSGQPMKASITGKVIKVWSVAEDGYDDKGISIMEARGAPYDVVAELPWRPSHFSRKMSESKQVK